MADQRLADGSFRATLLAALERTSELCIVITYAYRPGDRAWFLVTDEAGLDSALARLPAIGRLGRSDRIEAYGTPEFPYRSRFHDDGQRQKAIELLQQTGEVILACRLENDPELRDVDETDDPEDVNEWFRHDHPGERLVGAHPFRHDENPDSIVVWAYNLSQDGSINPGPY